MSQYRAIRGMADILPEETPLWQMLEQTARDVLMAHGYREIRTPIVESTDLFARSIGEVTDIVEKEMYTFLDRNDDSLSLRPEGTASTVRAMARMCARLPQCSGAIREAPRTSTVAAGKKPKKGKPSGGASS